MLPDWKTFFHDDDCDRDDGYDGDDRDDGDHGGDGGDGDRVFRVTMMRRYLVRSGMVIVINGDVCKW